MPNSFAFPVAPTGARKQLTSWLTYALAGPALAFGAVAAPPAAAQSWTLRASQAEPIHLSVNEALVLPVPGGAAKIFVANPDIADVEGSDPRRTVIYGRKLGTTSILVTTRFGAELHYSVVVGRAVDQLRANFQQLYPGNDLQIFDAPAGMTITGTMTNSGDAEKVRKMASQYLGNGETLNFNVLVTAGSQVNLHVRVIEVSREAAQSLGVNLGALIATGSTQIGVLTGRAALATATGTTAAATGRANADTVFSRSALGASSLAIQHTANGDTLTGIIDALKARDLLRVLAEPNLTTVSGETANFLAGGEIPVPVATGSGDNAQVSIEWKDFGVGLKFTPTILDPRNISIKVNSEVSELSDIGSAKLGNYSIPSIATRRVETTVNLALGQSFAIAGLYNERGSKSFDEFPGLGSIPILGELFRSRSYRNSRTELIIIVTPYLAGPVDAIEDIPLPADAPVPSDSPLLGPPASRTAPPTEQGAAAADPAAWTGELPADGGATDAGAEPAP